MGKRLVLVGIDGCHQATLYRLIESGEAPFFRRLADGGTLVKKAVTMFPSTTACCCSSLYTGCWYRNHGVLNNEWIDRFSSPVRGRTYIAGMRYALESLDKKLFGLPTILLPDLKKGGAVNNDLLAPTIYDEFTRAGLTSYTYFHYIGKGATRWMRPGRMDMVHYALVEKFHKPYRIYDKGMVGKAIRDCRRGKPDLLSIYFGGNDGHSHRHGVPAQMEYLRDFIDPELTRLSAALEKIYAGDDILWALVADHGQTNMTEADIPRCVGLHTFPLIMEAAGLSNFGRGMSDADLEPLDAVITLGHGAGFGFYLKNRKAGDWKTQPEFERDVVPLLNSILKANAGIGGFADWQWRGFLDFLMARRRFDEPYQAYVNAPPFDGPGRLVPLEEFFAGRDGGYVKPIERLRGIDHPKSPDVQLMLNYRDHFNVIEGDFHPGQHGGLLADDSYVPMIFSGPGVKRGTLEEAFTIDWAPTAASMMGVSMPTADGRVLPVV